MMMIQGLDKHLEVSQERRCIPFDGGGGENTKCNIKGCTATISRRKGEKKDLLAAPCFFKAANSVYMS